MSRLHRGGLSSDKGQATTGTRPTPVPLGSGEEGLEAARRRQTPEMLLHNAASSTQTPDERHLRNLPVQASPPMSRASTHLKLGLLWAFAGGGSFGEGNPTHCLFIHRVDQPPSVIGPPHAEVLPSCSSPSTSPLSQAPYPALSPRGQRCSRWQGPEPAPQPAQRKGQVDLQQLLSLKDSPLPPWPSGRPEGEGLGQGQAGANAQD